MLRVPRLPRSDKGALHPKQRRVIALVVALAGLVSILIAFGWLLPAALVRPSGPISAAERLKAENDVRATLLQALAGAALLSGLYFTARTYQLNRHGQITDRFSKAIEQLGDDRLDVRLGGIYALERIARDSRIDHWPVMEVLTAFVRERAPSRSDVAVAEPANRVPTDIQAVLTVLGRRQLAHEDEHQRLDLRSVDLGGADLTRLNLARADLERANLAKANAAGVVLEAARLNFACLAEADLSGAVLSNSSLRVAAAQAANFIEARLDRCFLDHATFDWARLMGADLSHSILRGTSFRNANLTGANFDQALVGGTHLESATIEHATNLTGAQLRFAITDDSTRLPLLADEES